MSEEAKPVNFSSKTVSHLKSYPLVSDLLIFVFSLPILAAFIAHIKPFYLYIRNLLLSIGPVRLIVARIDDFVALTLLTSLETSVPALKNTHFENVRAVVTPKNIRPVVTARVDPLVKPLNDRFEKVIETYLPKPEDSALENPDEIARAVNLVSLLYSRTLPVALNEVSALRSRVSETYKSNLPEKASTAAPSERIAAIARTLFQLGSKGLEYVRGEGAKGFEGVKNKVDGGVERVVEGVEGVEK